MDMKSIQPVLERGSIDIPLTFDVGLIQLSFIPVCSPNTCKCVFNPNVTIFLSNCTEDLYFSAFHYKLEKKNRTRINIIRTEQYIYYNCIIRTIYIL